MAFWEKNKINFPPWYINLRPKTLTYLTFKQDCQDNIQHFPFLVKMTLDLLYEFNWIAVQFYFIKPKFETYMYAI